MKKIIIALFLMALIAAGIGAYLWNKPHRTADDGKAVCNGNFQSTVHRICYR